MALKMSMKRNRHLTALQLVISMVVALTLAAGALYPAASTPIERLLKLRNQIAFSSTKSSDALRVPANRSSAEVRFVPLPVASLWNAATTYATSDVVNGSDGNAYRATSGSTSINPTAAITRKHWELLAISNDTLLLVPSRFSTINAALDFAVNARIDGDTTLTIQVADGTYNYGTTSIIANHPDGARLRLRGNPLNPAKCKIIWNSYHSGIVVSDGHRLGLVEGFELIGQGDRDVPPFTTGPSLYPPSNNGDGIGAYYGATVSVRNCIVRKWLHGVTAWGGSHVDVFDTTATNCWDSGLFGYNNSSLYARNCVADNNTDNDGLGYGIILEGASSGFLQNCSATGNRIAGVYANDGSCVVMRRCTVTRNGDGILLRAATMEGDTNKVSDNRDGGVHFVAGSSGWLFATNCSNNGRNFWSEENSVIQIRGSENYSTNAAIAGFSCKTGGLITGTANVPPSNIFKNGVDYEKYTPPISQYIP